MINSDKNHDLSVVYKETMPFLLRYGSRFTSNTALVEDCIHDLFVELFEKEDLSEIVNMKFYLLRSFKNILLKNVKSRKKYENIDELFHNYQHDNSVEEQFIESERIRLLKSNVENIIENLSERDRKFICLYFIEQLSYEDICKLTGATYQTARNIIHRSLKRIKKREFDVI